MQQARMCLRLLFLDNRSLNELFCDNLFAITCWLSTLLVISLRAGQEVPLIETN